MLRPVLYLLLFSLLHLSSSACGAAVDVEEATACRWNRRLLDVPSSSSSSPAPAAVVVRQDNHVVAMMNHAASGEHVWMSTARRLLGRRTSPAPDVEVHDNGGMSQGDEKEAAGGEAGKQSPSELIITGDVPERDDDIGIDYPAPRTHPPSHN